MQKGQEEAFHSQTQTDWLAKLPCWDSTRLMGNVLKFRNLNSGKAFWYFTKSAILPQNINHLLINLIFASEHQPLAQEFIF